MSILIFGGKSLNNIFENLIGNYARVCRINFNLQGDVKDKEDLFFLNNHVFNNFYIHKKTEKELIKYYKNVNSDLISLFSKKRYEFKYVMEQYESNKNIKSNKILDTLGCPVKFQKAPRCGHQAIMYHLDKGLKVFVSGFTIRYGEEQKTHNSLNTIGKCHDTNSELDVLYWLHKNNKIDITPCMLDEYTLPFLKCNYLYPNESFILMCLKNMEFVYCQSIIPPRM